MKTLKHIKEDDSERESSRTGLKDIWNAFMCEDAQWDGYDIPFCPTTAISPPSTIITWTEAKSIFKKSIASNRSFKNKAFVCFYEDDYKFDGARTGIWANPKRALEILMHFGGIITPDFSTYQDFPYPLKIYNTYRMRAFGYWCSNNGLNVINNIRWGTEETFSYCFSGVEKNSTISIGTVGGSPRKLQDRYRFENGLNEAVKVLSPRVIIVYGSSNYSCLRRLEESGIKIIAYPGTTSAAFSRRRHE